MTVYCQSIILLAMNWNSKTAIAKFDENILALALTDQINGLQTKGLYIYIIHLDINNF